MKINKSSWHYRLISSGHRAPSKNFCIYFWQLVFSMLLCILLGVILIAAFTSLVGGIAVFILPFYFDVFSKEIPKWVNLLMLYGIVFWIFAFIFACDKSITLFKLRQYRKRRIRVTKEPEPSLIAEYIKAKKQKVCPMIEFEEKQ